GHSLGRCPCSVGWSRWRRTLELAPRFERRTGPLARDGRPSLPEVTAPRRRRVRGTGAVMVVVLVWLAWSIGGALSAPGADGTSVRLAQWARSHGLGWAVTAQAQVHHQLNPPAVGRTPVGPLLTVPAAPPPGAGTAARGHLAAAGQPPRRTGDPGRVPASGPAGPQLCGRGGLARPEARHAGPAPRLQRPRRLGLVPDLSGAAIPAGRPAGDVQLGLQDGRLQWRLLAGRAER